MDRTPSKLYGDYPQQAVASLALGLEQGLQAAPGEAVVPIFFRADDIGVPSAAFAALLDSFSRHGLPLCLAVVPFWLTRARWEAMARLCDRSSPLWCWHQHGWRHRNHEPAGRKCEFGAARSAADIRQDLLRGKTRLQEILGPHFSPCFTPPWNRCSAPTIRILTENGYMALSRRIGAEPAADQQLPEFSINVDLHTRREPDAAGCLAGLTSELERAAAQGRIGIMIHHQRMNARAFELLDGLLDLVCREPRLQPLHFGTLLG